MVSSRAFLQGCKFLAGALSVHFVMAACSAGGASSKDGDDDTSAKKKKSSTSSDDDDPTTTANADDSKSGSRLKVRRITSSDGASATLGFYDSKLKMNCYFGTTDDGKTRCVPTGSDIAYVQPTAFADAACTQPAAYAAEGCVPKYGYQTSPACDSRFSYFAIGAKLTQVYMKSGASCTMTAVTANQAVFAVDGDVTPDTFQAGTEETE